MQVSRAVHYYIIIFVFLCGFSDVLCKQKERMSCFYPLAKHSLVLHISYLMLFFLPHMYGMLNGHLPPGTYHLSLSTVTTSHTDRDASNEPRTSTYIQPFFSALQVFFFAAPPGMRLNFLGSFLDMRDLSRVPLPPSQKPWPFLPTRPAWQMPQSSGR
jgi:hypothetical protein